MDDLLTDWRTSMTGADATIGLDLFVRASEEQVADAGDLVDPTLHRSTAGWDELELPPRVLDLATRVYDAYGTLVGTGPAEQVGSRTGLDDLWAELTAYYDECFDVARTRTGAFARREKRKAARRVREEMRQATAEEASGAGDRFAEVARRAVGRLRKTPS
jgi:hypothetical protein